MTTGEIETNLDVRTLETMNATSRIANKTLFDVSGLVRYPDIEFLNNDHDFKQRDMFCRDGQGLSFKGTELLVSRIENVIQRMLSRAVPLDSAADYSESAPAVESRVHLTGGGSISSEDNVQDDFTSIIYSNCDVKLKHSEAAEMLDNPDISKLSNFPPFKPKGGSVYLLTDGQKIQNKDDWRADGYTWRNYGKNKVTNGDKIIEKSYFRIKNGKEESDNFQKVMLRYYGSDYNHITIVQYWEMKLNIKVQAMGIESMDSDSILMNDTLNDDYSAFAPENICSLSHSTPKIIKQRCTEFQSSSISSPKTPKTPKVVIVSPKRTPKSILKKSKKNLFEPLETDVPDPKRTKLEIPLLECSNSAEIPDNDLVNLSDSRNDNVNLEDLPDVSPKNTRDQQTGIFWLPNLGLKISDKEAILNNDKINSEIIEAVNTLARNQFSSISGLQLPEKVPKYITKENRWHVQQNAVMSQIPNDKSLACQIHHTGRDHWVVSFRDETDSLFMFDSLGIERPTRFIMTPSRTNVR